jgi:GTP-binding protein Era
MTSQPPPLAETPAGFRSGFVALVGRPNVGKSTLTNLLVGQKVSITATKPQTTRHRVSGVVDGDGWQIVLLDIPGFQKPLDLLTERMQELVEHTVGDVDAVLFLLSAEETIGRGDAYIAAALVRAGAPVVLALNKVDAVSEEQLSHRLEQARALEGLPAPLLLSALSGEGTGPLLEGLASLLPEGPRYFPPGVITDQPEELLIAELVREKAIWVTEEEVPHSLAVQVLEREPRERGLVYLRVAIYVERDSQKPIILGEGGARIKEIGTQARKEIQTLIGSPVYLELVVKVRKHWRQDRRMLEGLGL